MVDTNRVTMTISMLNQLCALALLLLAASPATAPFQTVDLRPALGEHHQPRADLQRRGRTPARAGGPREDTAYRRRHRCYPGDRDPFQASMHRAVSRYGSVVGRSRRVTILRV